MGQVLVSGGRLITFHSHFVPFYCVRNVGITVRNVIDLASIDLHRFGFKVFDTK